MILNRLKGSESFWILPSFFQAGLLRSFSDVIVIMPIFRYYELERYFILQVYSITLIITALFHLLIGYLADRIGANYIPRILLGINAVFFIMCLGWIIVDVRQKEDLASTVVKIDTRNSQLEFNISKEQESLVIICFKFIDMHFKMLI